MALLAAPASSRRPHSKPCARSPASVADLRPDRGAVRVVPRGRCRARRVGDDSLAAHQIAFQLFVFLALILDAIAIAGQVIVGRSLGAGDADGAHRAARRMIEWAVAAGLSSRPHARSRRGAAARFTGDEDVVERAEIWLIFALMQPANEAVFALGGILIGAGDTRYLMWAMLFSTFGVFIPITLASLAFDWGIVGVWFGLLGLILARLATLRGASRTALGQDRAEPGPSLASALRASTGRRTPCRRSARRPRRAAATTTGVGVARPARAHAGRPTS